LLTAIANGEGVALAPESTARYYARPRVTCRPRGRFAVDAGLFFCSVLWLSRWFR